MGQSSRTVLLGVLLVCFLIVYIGGFLVFRAFSLIQQSGVKSDSRRRRHMPQSQSCLTPQIGKFLDRNQLFACSGVMQAGNDSCNLGGILGTCGNGFYRGSADLLVELSLILVSPLFLGSWLPWQCGKKWNRQCLHVQEFWYVLLDVLA